jgi:hypothetical protein
VAAPAQFLLGHGHVDQVLAEVGDDVAEKLQAASSRVSLSDGPS